MTSPDLGYFEEQDKGSVRIADVWSILWRRRIWLIGAALLCGGLALAYCLLTPPLYSATAQVLVDPRGLQVVANDINPGALAPDGGLALAETQSQVVASSSVLLRAIGALDLTKDKEFGARPGGLSALIGALKAGFGLGAGTPASPEAVTLKKLSRALKVSRADKAFVIYVSISSQDAEKSARVVNAVIDAYLAEQTASLSATAIGASNSLSANLEDQRQKVREAADALAAYKAANNLVDANDLLVTDQTLSERVAALSAARARTALQRSRLERLNGAGEDATREAVDSPTISELRNQEAELVRSQAELTQELGPRHPSLRKVAAELADLRSLIGVELKRIRQAAQQDLDSAVAYETELSTSLEQLKQVKANSDRAAVGLEELKRELDARRTVYANYLQRAQETREQANVNSSNVRVISRALPPVDKSWPPTALLVLASAGLGFGLAATGALLYEYVSPTVGVTAGAANSPAVEAEADAMGAAVEVVPLAGASSGRGGIDPVLKQAVQRYAREGRSLLVLSGEDEAQERRELVRSMLLASALEGRSVLLVDADLQGRSTNPGLADVLAGNCSLRDAVAIDTATGIGLIGCGRGSLPPPERRIYAEGDLVSGLGDFFDFVIVGGSARTARELPGLLASADSVVFASAIGRDNWDELAATAAALGAMGKRVSGTLLLDAASNA